MLCVDITCLCMISFVLNDFSKTEQNQLMSTSLEQNVDREKGRMLRIYIFLLLLLPSFTTTTFLFFSFSTTITSRFLYFLPPPLPPQFYRFLLPPLLPHFYFFPPGNSIKDRKLSQLVQFVSSTVSRLSISSAPVSLTDSHSSTATCISPSLIQCTYEYILIPEENKWKVF